MPFCPSSAPQHMDGERPATATGAGAGTAPATAIGPAGLLQQLHRRVRSRCCPNESGASERTTPAVQASVGSVGLALPCLLESWKRRIECMSEAEGSDATDRSRPRHGQHRGLHHHHRSSRCHRQRHRDRSAEGFPDSLAPPETSSSTGNETQQQQAAPPAQPPCLFRGFELPKLMHPRLERQRACASLSGIWGVVISPPSSPEGDGPAPTTKTWRRCHPYWRSNGAPPSAP